MGLMSEQIREAYNEGIRDALAEVDGQVREALLRARAADSEDIVGLEVATFVIFGIRNDLDS